MPNRGIPEDALYHCDWPVGQHLARTRVGRIRRCGTFQICTPIRGITLGRDRLRGFAAH